ncbi:MAG TPA: M28 family metallopeptidase [Woeseiaceae bacterium]|nr:M28 family metallopeptidase [Woeseiaceae bacterium]
MSRTRPPLLLLALSLLYAGCSPAPDDGPEPAGPAAAPAAAAPAGDALAVITTARLQAHLDYLASDERTGRMTGTAGYDDAAAYVARQFEQLGLTPGGTDGWYQPVPLRAARLDADGATFIVHRDDGDERLAWKQDFLMSGDDVRAETSVRAGVVFAGFGVHAPDMGYSDFEGIDLEGRIALIFGGAPPTFPHNERAFYSSGRTKSRELVARGAVGVIVMRTRVDQQRYTWELITLNAGLPAMAWTDASGNVQDYHPELEGGAFVHEDVARALFAGAPVSYEEALDAAEAGRPLSTPLGVEVTLARHTDHEDLSSPNVIGIVEGADPALRDEYVVYSAHLDHVGIGEAVDGDDIYNGYYDNAMGVALMIEAARAIAAQPEPPRRSILFIAVTGEERGLLGSDYFAHYPTVPPRSIVANVNLDMPLFLFPITEIIAFGAEHSSLGDVIEAAIAGEGLELAPDPFPEEVIFIRSDQYSFVRQGVPSVFLVPGFGSSDPEANGAAAFQEHMQRHYHRPSDDASRPVHWESALGFARANVRIGLAVANATARPTWNEGDFFGLRFAPVRSGDAGRQ